jgi:hypothetical protein
MRPPPMLTIPHSAGQVLDAPVSRSFWFLGQKGRRRLNGWDVSNHPLGEVLPYYPFRYDCDLNNLFPKAYLVCGPPTNISASI